MRARETIARLVTFGCLVGCASPPSARPTPAAVSTVPAPARPVARADALLMFKAELTHRYPGLAMGEVAPDSGMHDAPVADADVDAAETMLVTGAPDKTARVWALKTGRLLAVLRLPRAGQDGKVNAVAFSPNGQFIAVGGWDGIVYIFRSRDWRLSGAVASHGSSILSMRYSPDGARLAIGLWSSGGVHVLETETYREIFADRDYAGDAQALAFDRDGRLAVASWDGAVRLYSRELALIAKRDVGGQPLAVAFDPEGRLLAVGFTDRPVVSLLAMPRLDVVRELSIPHRYPTDGLGSVAWSRDGSLVLAGGRYNDAEGWSSIVRWSRDGSRLDDWHLARNTNNELVALSNGALAVASQDPLVGVLDSQGAARWSHKGRIPDFKAQVATMRFSADGGIVQFTWDTTTTARLAFDARRLRFVSADERLLRAARTNLPGYDIASWKNVTAPTLNGAPLEVGRFETCRSLAIDAPRGRFVLGCEWNMYLFDRTGRSIWSRGTASAREVNVSEDGRITVAASTDGTIRWMLTDTGEPLLSLFLIDGGRDWVAWTPDGFFAGSPFGESLLGIHALNSDGSSDFISMVQFAATMRRPDVVSHALDSTP
jgi:YD repeat-containing protein